MSDLFNELAQLQNQDREALFDRLVAALQEQKDYHKLFDARMLKRKAELELPLCRPASLSDVPDSLRKEVEATYIEAAREVGRRFLEEGDIPSAWMYLQVIREPQTVAAAIEALPDGGASDDITERIIRIALYEGVNPVKGVRMMLQQQGTCSTITSLDQAMANLKQADREACAKVMVRELYENLRENVERQVQQRIATLPPGESLRDLLVGRDWLLEGGNFHIDVSHLNSVVRFARSIEPSEELKLALQLAEYGAKLDPQLQYPGDAPFEDYYTAHVHFFKAILGENQEEGLQYFRDKLEQEPDELDKPLLAYVLVDLLMRTGRLDEAVDVGAKYLCNLGEDVSFSFAELCQKAGRLETLQQVMRERNDPVGYVAALVGR